MIKTNSICKESNDVYIYDIKQYIYNNNEIFNPSKKFPEGINIDIKSDEKIYTAVRDLFIKMGLDEKNIGTKNWNPFKDFIKANNRVVIKPNLVYHINHLDGENTDSLITNFSIIRPIIDYAILALNNTGIITVGDAPVQECVFEEVIKINGLKEAIEIYNRFGYHVELIDFRKNENHDLECIEVALDDDSSLNEVDKYYKQFAISNYDLKIMHNHHNLHKHEYLLPKIILESDVIINIPKAKTHRIAGMTACMKNFVGANAKKEYLPHHRNGNIYHNGDEFPEKSLVKNLQSHVKNYTYLHNGFVNFLNLGLRGIMKVTKKNKYIKGCWYGNDTIWRTILDINKIILYASKTGKMCKTKQRTVFNIVDMVVSGEKEGPLKPTAKNVGLILASFNQLNLDRVIASVMGFSNFKIKYIKNGYELEKYKISTTENFKIYDCDGVVDDLEKYNKHFLASAGWQEFLNKND